MFPWTASGLCQTLECDIFPLRNAEREKGGRAARGTTTPLYEPRVCMTHDVMGVQDLLFSSNLLRLFSYLKFNLFEL